MPSTYIRYLLLVGLTLLNQSWALSQMINNKDGKAFESPLTFNRSFLWENKIAQIHETTVIKMAGRPLVDSDEMATHYFDYTGLLERTTKQMPQTENPDTASILYKRNDIGQLFLIEATNGKNITITENNYDPTGKLNRTETKERILQEGLEPRDILIESTTYEYSFPKQNTIRRENINNYGLAYSAITTERNEQGFLLSETEEWYISKKVITKVYTYNEMGWVSSVVSTSNMNEPEEKIDYTYDNNGNVQTAKKYLQKKAVEEYEVIYQNNALVKAILHQDLSSTAITIHKYEYTFRP
jgi:hypothetical protein